MAAAFHVPGIWCRWRNESWLVRQELGMVRTEPTIDHRQQIGDLLPAGLMFRQPTIAEPIL